MSNLVVFEDKVRKKCIYMTKCALFLHYSVWGWSRKGLRFLHRKGHSFPSPFSPETCVPLQSEYRTTWIRNWTTKALAESHKDFTYLRTWRELRRITRLCESLRKVAVPLATTVLFCSGAPCAAVELYS